MKYNYPINGTYYNMGTNSQFAGCELRNKLNNELDKIAKRYDGFLRDPSFSSSTKYDAYRFQVRGYLRDLFGNDGLSYYTVSCRISLGKGKKNLGNNNLSLYPTIHIASNNSDKEYEAAFQSLRKNLESRLPNDSFNFTNSSELVDALAERLYDMDGRMRQLLKDEWIRAHDEQTSRDIDFIGYVSEIKEIFKTAGANIKVDEENGLDKGSIEICPIDDDLYGRVELECTDGRWHIETATYTFNFVSDIFNLESGYSTRRYIRDGKLMEVIKIIAEEYVRQDRMRSDFKKVVDDYVEVVDKNK